MKERLEIREGERESVMLEGNRYLAQVVAVRRSGERSNYRTDCYYPPSEYQVFWWEGQGEITDKQSDKQYSFLLETPERCTCCYFGEKAYVHNLAGAIVYFSETGKTFVTPKPALVDEQQIVDLSLQKLVEQIKEFESKPLEERKVFIPTVTPIGLEVNELVSNGLAFNSQGQLQMVLK